MVNEPNEPASPQGDSNPLAAEPTALEQRVQQVKGFARVLASAMWILDERRQILEPLLNDEQVRQGLKTKLDGTPGARAYQQLVPLLAQDVLRDLARLFLDDDRRSGSLINVFRKASAPEVLAVLRAQHKAIPKSWNKENFTGEGFTEEELDAWRKSVIEQNQKEYEKSFDTGVETLKKAVQDLEADAVAKKILTFRNKNHAHLEMMPLGKDPVPFPVKDLGLTYNELFAFADRFMPAILELTRIVNGELFAVKSFQDAHKEYGLGFWRRLAGD
jgi:hypothetical protein